MGQSTDAEIAFGVQVPEDFELPKEITENGLDYYLAKHAGIDDPYDEIPEALNRGGTEAEFDQWKSEQPNFEKRVDRFWAAKRELEASAPIEVISHCSCEYPMYIIALRGSHLTASRGYPKVLNVAEMQNFGVNDVQKAVDFCKEHKLPEFVHPEWLLFSMWC